MDKIIIVNNGSTSKKYGLFLAEKGLIFAHFEKDELGDFCLTLTDQAKFEKKAKINPKEFENSFSYFLDLLLERALIESEDDIHAVVVRIVAPGKYFQKDQIVNSDFLEKLEETKEVSPIHIDNTRKEIGKILDRIPEIDLIGISDSAFYAEKPLKSSVYALPLSLAENYEIFRFGYHGISVQSALEKIKKQFHDKLPEKIIVCHLGGGASISAIKNGTAIENSMGFSPLDGVPMATRCGDLDIGAVLYLMEKEDLEIDEMRKILFNQSGLLGLSELSSDTRALLKAYDENNPKAKLALDYYVYEIQKIIGSYVAILGGVDLLIFTGTIGERAEKIRSMIIKPLGVFGLELDEDQNIKNDETDAFINKAGSPASIAIVKTDEMTQMAINALKII